MTSHRGRSVFLFVAALAWLPQLLVAEAAAVDLAARVDELFADSARSDAPGAAVAVVQDGRIVYQNGFGMADLERGVRIEPESVFEIGSVSKQFAAMSILLLENDGKLSVDDEVRKWIPELPEYEQPITIRHLLHHTSGIRDVETLIPLAGWPWVNYASDAQLLDLITRQKGLNFAPGEQYLYSNSGYVLLAQIVERVSETSFPDFADRRLFEPLEMRSSVFFDDPGQLIAGRAIPYVSDGKGGWELALWNLPFDGPSGLYTTVGDLARWDANFYDNRLGGGQELIEKMTTPGLLANGEAIDYAAGLVIEEFRGRASVSHGGAWMGYRSSMRRLPEERLTVIVLSNASQMPVGTREVLDLYLPPEDESEAVPGGEEASIDPPERTNVSLTSAQLAELEGQYWNASSGLLRTIENRDGTLYYARTSGAATELGALDPTAFYMIGPSVEVDVVFELKSDEAPTMTVTVEGQEPLFFETLEAPDEAAMGQVAGRYWSEELERQLVLAVEGDGVEVSWSDDDRAVGATFVGADELLVPALVQIPWYTQDVRLVLGRGETGPVKGLTLNCDMVRGVSFVRQVD